MKKSCLLWLAVFAAIWAGYYLLLKDRGLDPAAVGWMSFFGGIAGWFLASAVWTLRNAGDEVSALRRAQAGEAPQDGRLEAAAGPIYPLREPLVSPLEGRECVAYEYEIGHKGGDEPVKDFTGFALTPSTIRTSRGSVLMLGWSMLDAFPKRRPVGPHVIERAKAYLRDTLFEKVTLRQVPGLMSELFTDDDGSMRRDIRITDKPEMPMEDRFLSETCVPVGEHVVGLGVFSLAKGGLVAVTKGAFQMTQLFPGDVEGAVRRARKKVWGSVIFGVVFAVLVNAGIWAVLRNR